VDSRIIEDVDLDNQYQEYYAQVQKKYSTIPNVKGISGMDAVSLLENLGIEVEVRGNGKVKNQSVNQGTNIKQVKKIVLELS
jgi:cell division protein FtsI (penicillin-binding protein 3)